MANGRRSRSHAEKRPVWSLTYGVDNTVETIIGNKVQPDPVTGCWVWTGQLRKGGYPTQHPIGLVHRFVYDLLVNPIPEGYVVHHECENRACVNPDHLRAMRPGDHIAYHNARR